MLTRKTPMRRVSAKKEESKRMGLSEMKKSELVQKASEFTSRPRKKIKPRSPKNKGGQVALFKRIWDNRSHKCEVCSSPIEQPAASNFSHLLPKGTYPDFKLREDNIVIKCQRCHDVWHHYSNEHLSGYYMWMPIVDRYNQLHREANNITE